MVDSLAVAVKKRVSISKKVNIWVVDSLAGHGWIGRVERLELWTWLDFGLLSGDWNYMLNLLES